MKAKTNKDKIYITCTVVLSSFFAYSRVSSAVAINTAWHWAIGIKEQMLLQ